MMTSEFEICAFINSDNTVYDGEWVDFPISEKEIKSLERKYPNYYFTDYESYGLNLTSSDIEQILGSGATLEKFNELELLFEDACKDGYIEKILSIIEANIDKINSFDKIVEYFNNVNEYQFIFGVENEYELGKYMVDNMIWTRPQIFEHFDYAEYGADILSEMSDEETFKYDNTVEVAQNEINNLGGIHLIPYSIIKAYAEYQRIGEDEEQKGIFTQYGFLYNK